MCTAYKFQSNLLRILNLTTTPDKLKIKKLQGELHA